MTQEHFLESSCFPEEGGELHAKKSKLTYDLHFRAATQEDFLTLYQIWYSSTEATHDFWSEDELAKHAKITYDRWLPYFLPVSTVAYFTEKKRVPKRQFAFDDAIIAEDERQFSSEVVSEEVVAGFTATLQNKVQALFVDAKHFRRGIGQELLNYAIWQIRAEPFVLEEDSQIEGDDEFGVEVESVKAHVVEASDVADSVGACANFPCGTEIPPGGEAVYCPICSVEKDCIICLECLQKKADCQKEGHSFVLISCPSGGLCDYGDPSGWRPRQPRPPSEIFTETSSSKESLKRTKLETPKKHVPPYKEVYLDVDEENHQARAFYEKQGFEVLGREPVDENGDPHPFLHLVLKCSH